MESNQSKFLKKLKEKNKKYKTGEEEPEKKIKAKDMAEEDSPEEEKKEIIPKDGSEEKRESPMAHGHMIVMVIPTPHPMGSYDKLSELLKGKMGTTSG